MKKAILVLLALSMVLIATGCANVQSTLVAPTNLSVEDGVLKWNSVDGAISYLVYVNGTEYLASTNQFDLKTLNLELGETYKLAVKAKGDGYVKMTGGLSEELEWTAPEQQEGGLAGGEDVTDKAFVSDRLFELGLGYGVNALTGDSIFDELKGGSTRRNAIFDEQLLLDSVSKFKLAASAEEVAISKSIEEYMSSANQGYFLHYDASVNIVGLFSAGIETKFDINSAISNNLKTNQCYATYKYNYAGEIYQLKNYMTSSSYRDELSSDFLESVEEVSNGEMSAEEFFNAYGTHIVMGVVYGGMINLSYASFTRTKQDTESIKTQFTAGINAGIQIGDVGAGGGTSTGAEIDEKHVSNNSDSVQSLEIKMIGGTPKTPSTFAAYEQDFSAWSESMKNKNNYAVVDVAQGGLVPVWFYLPSKYNNVKDILSDYFEDRAEAIGSALSSKLAAPGKADVITVEFNAENCRDHNSYRVDLKAEEADDRTRHDDFAILDGKIHGCNVNSGKYSIVNYDDFSIKLHLLQNPKQLPIKSGEDNKFINNDLDDDVNGTSIGGQDIGYGAYWIRVTYTDNTQTVLVKNPSTNEYEEKNSIVKQNFLENKINGEYIEILNSDNLSNDKVIKTIELTIVYEIHTSKNGGVFGIGGWNEDSSWRIDYTFNFQ